MFDAQLYDDLGEIAERVATAREHTGLASGTQACDALRTVQKALDVLDGVQADLLSRVEDTEGYTDEGASTVWGWARQQLRMGVGEAARRTKAGRTLRTLTGVADALAQGRIRAAHVDQFTAGITKLGADVMADAEEILLPIAESEDPSVLREAISHLHEVLHPDDLDEKYAKGMARRDLNAAKCGEGWHVTGFLDPITGTRFYEWLKSVSGPEYEGDDRAPSARRVDAFDRLLDTTEHAAAEPSSDVPDGATAGGDTGEVGGRETPRRQRRASVQLLVLADLEALLRMPGAEPATLAGFGHIGAQLLGYLTCGAETTGVLADGVTTGPVPQADVLNVGRASRLATGAQRHAVIARQDGVCATPGCSLTHLEVHHAQWWHRDAGRTDLDNLLGLCSRCHHLVHQNKLTIRPDGHRGFTFDRHTGARIDDHTRAMKQRVRGRSGTTRARIPRRRGPGGTVPQTRLPPTQTPILRPQHIRPTLTPCTGRTHSTYASYSTPDVARSQR